LAMAYCYSLLRRIKGGLSCYTCRKIFINNIRPNLLPSPPYLCWSMESKDRLLSKHTYVQNTHTNLVLELPPSSLTH